MSKPVVIIPSIRTIDARHIAAIPEDVDIFVVDDSDGSIKPTRPRMKVFTYADQRDVMGPDYDLIPHKTAACRNFAFYYVYKYTDHDLIITIDDDCLLPPDFMSAYSAASAPADEWPNVTVSDGWYNTIEYLGVAGERRDGRSTPRLPVLAAPAAAETRRSSRGRLVCVMGLWSNVLDYDGIDKYLFEDYRAARQDVERDPCSRWARPPPDQVLVLRDELRVPPRHACRPPTRCRWIARSCRATRSGGSTTSGPATSSRRWCTGAAGGDVIGIGNPVVKHLKEGNLHREVHGEHLGHLMAPYFYAFIDAGVAEIAPGTYRTCTSICSTPSSRTSPPWPTSCGPRGVLPILPRDSSSACAGGARCSPLSRSARCRPPRGGPRTAAMKITVLIRATSLRTASRGPGSSATLAAAALRGRDRRPPQAGRVGLPVVRRLPVRDRAEHAALRQGMREMERRITGDVVLAYCVSMTSFGVGPPRQAAPPPPADPRHARVGGARPLPSGRADAAARS